MPSGRKRSCFSMSAEKKPACRSLRVRALELRSMLSAVAGPVAPLVAEASFADLSARVVAASPLRSPGESIRMTVPALMASPEVVAGPTLSVSAEATPAGTTIVAPRTTRITDAIFAQPQDRLDSTDAAAREVLRGSRRSFLKSAALPRSTDWPAVACLPENGPLRKADGSIPGLCPRSSNVRSAISVLRRSNIGHNPLRCRTVGCRH